MKSEHMVFPLLVLPAIGLLFWACIAGAEDEQDLRSLCRDDALAAGILDVDELREYIDLCVEQLEANAPDTEITGTDSPDTVLPDTSYQEVPYDDMQYGDPGQEYPDQETTGAESGS